MFDVGFWELALIFGVGLLILGPERMPRVASQIGRWVGRARRTASTLRRQLEQEIASADSPPPPPRRKPKPLTPVNSPASATKDKQPLGDDKHPESPSDGNQLPRAENDEQSASENDHKPPAPTANHEHSAPEGDKQEVSPEDAAPPTKKADDVVGQSADDS